MEAYKSNLAPLTYLLIDLTCIFQKKELFVQSHSVDLCTENHVLFFDKNLNLKVKAVSVRIMLVNPIEACPRACYL